MEDQTRRPEKQINPLQFAFNVGVLIMEPNAPGEETIEGVQALLANMACELSPETAERLDVLNSKVGDTPIDRDSPVFVGLIQTTTAALLMRDNRDVVVLDNTSEQGALAQAAASLLNGFVDGIVSNGFSASYTRQCVKSEIVAQQKKLESKSSYSAVGAVRFLDDILNLLKLDDLGIKTRRLIRGLRAFRTFGGDIFTR